MPLVAGTTLGPYEIVSPLGSGGMGEVYRARDTRLDRTVAIKVISSLLAGTPELRERFDREARAISQLNHPHICTLHDVGHDRGVDYLVLEYLEGRTLADRLAAADGPLPVKDAIEIGIQICDALDKAHRHGIVHRDLKPGNVFLTRSKSGTSRAPIAKLLDFGLAKSLTVAPASAMVTRTSPATAQGAVVGTLQYMSPEQAEGHEADIRSDIFSFGALFYEMVTGRRAFAGETPASVLSAILRDTPPAIVTVVPIAPPALDRVVGRCLEKDPDDRWQSARDVLLMLRDLAGGEREASRATASRAPFLAALAVALLALGAAGWLWTAREPPAPVAQMRLSIMLPAGYDFRRDTPEMQLSPDGRHLALALSGEDGVPRVFIRSLASHELRPIPGTDGGTQPFWSPDGRHIAFVAGGRLKRVEVAGGPVQTICDATEVRGAAWGAGDVILFAPNPSSGIVRVPAGGGQPQPVTRPASPRESHRYPSFLPDGRRFIYVSVSSDTALYAASLDGGPPSRLREADSTAVYTNGYLLFASGGVLMAQPFDERALRTTGEAELVGEEVDAGGPPGSGAFTAATTGLVAYVAGSRWRTRDLVWRERGGAEAGRLGETRRYLGPTLSPDDRRVAVAIEDSQQRQPDLWVMNVARGVGARLTAANRADWFPVWSRDGHRLVFRSGLTSGGSKLIDRRTNGQERSIAQPLFPTSITPDGATIVGHDAASATGWDIMALSGDAMRPLVATPYTDVSGMVSPDGQWLAWTSDESGTFEVYVARFPDLQDKQRVSSAGGSQPAWRGDSRELFYVAADGRLMAVEVRLVGDELDLSAPKPLFRIALASQTTPFYNNYAVTSDGLRFLVMEPPPHAPPISVRVYTGLAATGRE